MYEVGLIKLTLQVKKWSLQNKVTCSEFHCKDVIPCDFVPEPFVLRLPGVCPFSLDRTQRKGVCHQLLSVCFCLALVFWLWLQWSQPDCCGGSFRASRVWTCIPRHSKVLCNSYRLSISHLSELLILTCKTVRKTLFKTIAIGERDGPQLQTWQRPLGVYSPQAEWVVSKNQGGAEESDQMLGGGFSLTWLSKILAKTGHGRHARGGLQLQRRGHRGACLKFGQGACQYSVSHVWQPPLVYIPGCLHP